MEGYVLKSWLEMEIIFYMMKQREYYVTSSFEFYICIFSDKSMDFETLLPLEVSFVIRLVMDRSNGPFLVLSNS